ncbi:hypothetical protein AKJ65_06585 [candidate division MSBL1 archaeon SCGC-AAA259E19]|uniref:Uncharacterized protein n=2 Tax=candidate division MSBL1 TaxID=215777 RepID=A0A133UP02_9EURY|nr:hypothetical protein AKJ65_06585 [candidate division MSBL1 archaeon SCGC-AAA259E19]KXA95952.1 hypothetical protein AKJ38_04195 [candidate division MSBL1 archaeon SCGC-AAA259I14]
MSGKREEHETAIDVSRKLTGKLRKGDKIMATKECGEMPSYVPIPDPQYDFEEYICPRESDLVLRHPKSGNGVFFLYGDSQVVVDPGSEITLVFTATERTLDAYHVTLKDLLEFAGVLEERFGYEVRIVPRGVDSDGG